MTRPTKVVAASVALACIGFSAGASAQSSVSIYGLVDMSAGQYQTAGAPKLKVVDSGRMSTSFLGFKGTEDLGGGTKAVFQIETFLRADTGQAGRFNGDSFWARSAYVGIGSNLGTVTLGRTSTPLFVSTLVFNAFGDSFGYSPSIRQYFGDAGAVAGEFGALLGDSGWNNSVSYSSPKMGGVVATVSANLGEGTGTGRNIGGNLIYFGGPISATIVAQEVKNNTLGGFPATVNSQKTYQVGGAYDFGIVKPYLQYGVVTTDLLIGADVKTKILGVGAVAPVGPGNILAQYGQAKRDGTNSRRRTGTLGYDYALSKNTDVYALVMNDRVTGLANGNSYMAGMRLKF